MKHRGVVLAAGFVGLAVGVAVWAWLLPHRGVTRANFDRLRAGQSEAEVVHLLGGPADFPAAVAFIPDGRLPPAAVAFSPDGRLPKAWHGPGIIIRVWFDDRGRVSKVDLEEPVVRLWEPETFWDKVRRWSGLR